MNKELLNRFLSSIILIPLVIFLIMEGGIIFNIFIIICFGLTLFEWRNMSKKYSHYIPGIFFLFFSFISIYLLRNKFNGEYLYLFFILFICVATDIGGFIIGKLIKGPKLSKISPNKTYSGMLGSFLFSIIFSYFFFKISTSRIFQKFHFRNINIYNYYFSNKSIWRFSYFLF